MSAAPGELRSIAPVVGTLHHLATTPATCFWGFFDAALPPALHVETGDLIFAETLTHQAGDAPDVLMDEGTRAVYDGIPPTARGPGVYVMTGPIYVNGAAPGDTLEVRIMSFEPRLAYGTNIASWWGYLHDDFRKERITIYHFDADVARAAFAFDYTASARYDAPGVIVPPDPSAREVVLLSGGSFRARRSRPQPTSWFRSGCARTFRSRHPCSRRRRTGIRMASIRPSTGRCAWLRGKC